jgi:hypothetical protein
MGRQAGRAYQGAEVFLNVYDLSPMNDWGLHSMGLGIYHSGLEVHGVEYSYGGEINGRPVEADSTRTGLFTCSPGQAAGTIKLRTRIRLGQTTKTLKQVDELIARMGDSYLARDYNLLQRNCNIFCDSLAKVLLDGVGIPTWVNRAASVGRCCPCCFSGGGRRNGASVTSMHEEKDFKAFSGKGYKLEANDDSPPNDNSLSEAADEVEAKRKRMADAALKRMQNAMATE